MTDISTVNRLLSSLPQSGKPSFDDAKVEAKFNPHLDAAISKLGQMAKAPEARAEAIAQVLNQNELDAIQRRIRQDRERNVPNVANPLALQSNTSQVPPFQIMIDKAVEALENISQMEFRVNDLTEQFIDGKVSIDEVSIEATKLNLAISFATTVISSATQTMKDLSQMAV